MIKNPSVSLCIKKLLELNIKRGYCVITIFAAHLSCKELRAAYIEECTALIITTTL